MNSFLQAVIAGQVRHYLTIAAGALVTYGLLQGADTGAFVQIGSGIAMGLIGMAWSGWQKSGHAIVISIVKKVVPEVPADAVPSRGVAI